MKKRTTLEQARLLNQESQVGLLFCYKALKKCAYDYQEALAYLKSDEFKNSIHKLAKR